MLNKIKKVSLRDILGIFKFIIVLIPAFIYKMYLKIVKKELWLICENENIARDNGYVFFEYMKEKHPEIRCFYAIDYKSPDYNKVKDLGSIVNWSSLKHYFLYMSATKNISSHKQGNPNQTLFTILHLYLHLYNNRIFLQHGVLYQNLEMFHKKNCYFKMFICGAKPEYDFILQKYGYDKDEVKYTGLARFDNLHNKTFDKHTILYMPTWRRYLTQKKDLLNSEYFNRIFSFINSDGLEKLLEKYNMNLVFCLHDGLRECRNLFTTKNKNVNILDITKTDIQKLLIDGAILITDFSSIHTDFAYMGKPIIYYQYDMNDFNQKHIGPSYKDTYFDFKSDGFGKVVDSEKDVIAELEKIINNNNCVEKKYVKRVNSFFELRDDKNCERIYERIVGE